MSLDRRATRRDLNERPIIDALEAVGAAVCQLSVKNWNDLLVVWRGQKFLLEVKNPDGGRVSDGQKKLHKELEGVIVVVWNVDEALAAIGAAQAPEITIDSVRIIFPHLHVKLSNGATYSTHLLDIPKLARATDKERKRRTVEAKSVTWPGLGLTIGIDEIRRW